MKATKKSPAINRAIDAISGDNRVQAVAESRCIKPPIGCGKHFNVEDLRDARSRNEYRMSGLCQSCQDKIIGV